MSIFLPNLPSLTELITQVSQKEFEILIRLRECVFERRINLINSRFLGCLANFLGEEVEIGAVMGQINFGVECPACFKMSRDDLFGVERFDQVERQLPGGENLGCFDFFLCYKLAPWNITWSEMGLAAQT